MTHKQPERLLIKRALVAVLVLSLLDVIGCRQAGSPAVGPPDAPGTACAQMNEHILNIREIRQQANNWCWAASGEMVLAHYNQHIRQCQQVNDRLGFTQCCALVVESECDQTGWPDFARYNLQFQRTNSAALSWEQIKSEVACKQNPIAFSWKWPGGSGHMMVIKGFRTVDGINYILVNDPLKQPKNRMMRYDLYVKSDSGNHTHWDDFYDFRKVGN